MKILNTDNNLPELKEISGIVERIIFQNNENFFTVCEISGDDVLTVVTGVLPYLAEGEYITAYGGFVSHKTFGVQFKAEHFEKSFPSGDENIEKYLSSGIIDGIGKATAARLMEKFGADVFNVIEHHPQWLTDVKGITHKKAMRISESFKEKAGLKNITDFFGSSVKMSTAVQIYQKFGKNTIEIVKDNPYVLCEKIYGINFKAADKIAFECGYKNNSPHRIAAGIKYVLKYNMETNGHFYIPADKLCEVVSGMLSVRRELLDVEYARMIERKDLIQSNVRGTSAAYTPRNFACESYCANKLFFLNKNYKTKINPGFNIEEEIQNIENELMIEYSEKQKNAIRLAITKGVFILTGGPGTGKTTIIKAIIKILDRLGRKILLAAPTGRAAQRITQTTGVEAKTIHRLLEVGFEKDDEPVFNRNEDNQLETDVLIVDEASMIDILIFESLMRACSWGIKVIIIGDADQLPPVGPGNIFRDILKCGLFSAVNLDVIYRQSEDSMITYFAHEINKGILPSLQNIKTGDFFYIERSSPKAILDTVVDLCGKRLPKTYGENVKGMLQIITPSKKGIAGTVNMNACLQELYNPFSIGKHEIKSGSVVFREGDKIMQMKNNYSLEWETPTGDGGIGIYNGDIGVIEHIYKENDVMTVKFDERKVEYPFSNLSELIHAYAITVHKSQGSEYPYVILPLSDEIKRLQTRNLLYTAITRAQKMLIVVGNKNTIAEMVGNNKKSLRYTGISEFFKAAGGSTLPAGNLNEDGDAEYEMAEQNDL